MSNIVKRGMGYTTAMMGLMCLVVGNTIVCSMTSGGEKGSSQSTKGHRKGYGHGHGHGHGRGYGQGRGRKYQGGKRMVGAKGSGGRKGQGRGKRGAGQRGPREVRPQNPGAAWTSPQMHRYGLANFKGYGWKRTMWWLWAGAELGWFGWMGTEWAPLNTAQMSKGDPKSNIICEGGVCRRQRTTGASTQASSTQTSEEAYTPEGYLKPLSPEKLAQLKAAGAPEVQGERIATPPAAPQAPTHEQLRAIRAKYNA